MAKTKTASVRLPKEMYEKIDSVCDEVGCSRNDWIKDTLQDKLREETNENSQAQEVIEDIKPEPKIIIEDVKEEPNPSIELQPTPQVTIKEIIQDNSNKPVVQFTQFNGKLLPFAKRYNL